MTAPSRLDAMRAMAARQPTNALIRFGLANELLKANLLEDAAAELAIYLDSYDDEGNGWLRYCDTLVALGRPEDARAAAVRGQDAARRHGHATLLEEFAERGY